MPEHDSKNCLFLWGRGQGSRLVYSSMDPQGLHPKRCFDRFSRIGIARAVDDTDHRYRPRYNYNGNNRPHLVRATHSDAA